MNAQTSYPVFETGQVLTSGLLNDILDYLEPQDRRSRVDLTGIGIVCGLEPDWDPGAATLRFSRGVAVTSEGYLIVEDETVFDRCRAYTVPLPSGPAATAEDKAKARYPFLFDGETQRQALELLPTAYQPSPGEAAPTRLTSQLVADKTVMLFLERDLESLKSCDVNDCSDKGSRMNLTFRRLLVTRDVAEEILDQEAEIAKRTVDRSAHPRLGLTRVTLDKINPAGNDIDSLPKLYQHFLMTAGKAAAELMPAMDAAWQAYELELADLFPAARFPGGPIPSHHFVNMVGALVEAPPLVQHLYDGMHDIVRSYDEFLACAARYDAECAPNRLRFPRHVLAGDVEAKPVSFAGAPKTLSQYANYDPLKATGGPAPEGLPAPRRHHFVTSPVSWDGQDRLAELRSLFSRMVLLAQTYATRGLLGAGIELTPSRDGAAPLGERAIPCYYRFEKTGDLFANWSWPKARANLTSTIHSYQFTAAAQSHPLLFRTDDQDFIRVEGLVGKPLGSAMLQLIRQKRTLGLAFSIEPVWIGLSDDAKQSQQEMAHAIQALQQVLLCRMRDLDVIFLGIMAALFNFMVQIVRAIGRLHASQMKPAAAATQPPAETAPAGGPILAGGRETLRLDPEKRMKVRNVSEWVLSETRTRRTLREDAVKVILEQSDEAPLPKMTVGAIFEKVRDERVGGELIDRVRAETAEIQDPQAVTEAVYPAVALMARSEEMMKVTSAPSLAEFDAQGFDKALRGFATAYETYVARAETNPDKVAKEVAEANQALLAQRGLVSTATSQLDSTAIMGEVQKRLVTLFQETTFAGFAKRHPGLEHKAGVPVGGTLVLLYGSRRALASGMRTALDGLGRAVGNAFEKVLQGNPPAMKTERVIESLAATSKPQSEDVLDELVILGDFCLPYQCCDACSDAVVERRIGQGIGVVSAGSGAEPSRPSPGGSLTGPVVPGSVIPGPVVPGPVAPSIVRGSTIGLTPRTPTTGTVETSVFERLARLGERPLAGAVLTITDLSTNHAEDRPLTGTAEALKLEPGTYSLVATSGAKRSEPVEVRVEAGGTVTARLAVT